MRISRGFLTWAIILLLFCGGGFAQTVSVTFIGTRTIATGTAVGGVEVGGLSGISYDEQSDQFRAVSDDSRGAGRGRVWTLDLSYDGTSFTAVTALSSQQLRATNGTTLPAVDCEGLAANLGGSFYISHEGLATGTDPSGNIPPWIWRFDAATGNKAAELALPVKFLPRDGSGNQVPPDDASQTSGVRSNLSLENLGMTPARTALFTANEAALKQDYSGTYNSDTNQAQNSEMRIVRYSGVPRAPATTEEKVYRAEQGTLFIIVRRFNTVPDLLPVGEDGRLLVLERGLTQNDTNLGSYRIRIYQVNFNEAAATNVAGIAALVGASYTRLGKTLVWESSTGMDNVEGFCFGRDVDGFRSLVLVSDNNFSTTQITQLHAFRTNLPAIPKYTLNLVTAGDGTAVADPSVASYPAGSEVALAATANPGNVFDGWSGDASGVVNPLFVTMDGNKSVTGHFLTLYQQWAKGYFTSAEILDGITASPGFDAEGDGAKNLLEYALNMHPRNPSPIGLPVVEKSGGQMTFIYQKGTTKADISYQVEVGSDLSGWANLADTLVSTNGEIETRRATVALGAVPKFLRLKITQLF
jgi:3-phytase